MNLKELLRTKINFYFRILHWPQCLEIILLFVYTCTRKLKSNMNLAIFKYLYAQISKTIDMQGKTH